MARGYNNILYEPGVLAKKKRHGLKRGARGSHPTAALDVLAGSGLVAYLDAERRLRVFPGDFRGEEFRQTRKEIVKVGDSDIISFSDKAFIYTHRKDFYIQDINTQSGVVGNVNFLAPALPGNIIGVHQGEEAFYCLWLSEGTASDINLSRKTYEPDSPWEDLSTYAVDGPVFMKTGRDTLLYYEGVYEPDALVTVAKDGPGDFLALEEKYLMKGDSRTKLLAPAGDDRYFALRKNGEEGVEVLLLSKSGAVRMGMLSESHSKAIFSLASGDGEVLDIDGSSSRGALLTDRALFLFSDDALLERMALDPSLDKDYDRVTLTDKGAILWQEGGKNYQEIILS